MKKDKSNSVDLLQPRSMEDRMQYLHRFESDRQMKHLFDNNVQRREIANHIFWDRWVEASATVTKANGEMFFID